MAPLRSAAVVDIDRDFTSPQFLEPGTAVRKVKCVGRLLVCPSFGRNPKRLGEPGQMWQWQQ